MTEVNPNLINRETFTAPGASADAKEAPNTAVPEKLLANILNGPSLSVTTDIPGSVIADIRQADYDSKMATAKNLVDDPKTRREKAERRKEEEAEKEALEADLKRADEKRELLDEIDSQRQASV